MVRPPAQRADHPRPVPAPVPFGAGQRAGLTAVAFAVILASVTFPLHDPDLWQHLRVGRAFWEGLGVPQTNVWTWPTFGEPHLTPSWLFRALLWPFWKAGGIPGVFVYRWLATAGAFALLLAAARARRTGLHPATGGAALVALVWCALPFRLRSQARPESLAVVLLALQLWLIERWRARGGGPRPWEAGALVLVACAWANAHISYWLGLFVTAAALLDAVARRRRGAPAASPRALAGVLAGGAVASFVNPFGWRLLAQPFEYAFVWRREPIFQGIYELAPPDWPLYLPAALPLLIALLVVLAVRRARRGDPDLIQLAILAALVPQALTQQRFIGFLVVAAAPFFVRDLAGELGSVRRPAALLRAGPRFVAIGAVLVAMGLPSFLLQGYRIGVGVSWGHFPVAACDWIEAHDVRGRSFNRFGTGGYLLWRFWPDRGRLPFIDIHQTGTREDRRLYVAAQSDSLAWRELDGRHRFDWVLLPRLDYLVAPLLDILDADTTTWSLVFVDDAAALWLRRGGSCAALAERERFRVMRSWTRGIVEAGRRAATDPDARNLLRAELERCAAESPRNATAWGLIANLRAMEGETAGELAALDRAASVPGGLQRLEERRGIALLRLGRPAEALAAFERERRRDRRWPDADLRRGQALEALGRVDEARAAYRRAMLRNPANGEGRAGLDRLEPR